MASNDDINSTAKGIALNIGQLVAAVKATFPNFVGAPATSSSAGTPGQVAYDATHFYVCVATNSWVRATLGTF